MTSALKTIRAIRERVAALQDALDEVQFLDLPEGVDVGAELSAISTSLDELCYQNRQRLFDRTDLRVYAQDVLALADRCVENMGDRDRMDKHCALGAIRDLASDKDVVYDLWFAPLYNKEAVA